MKIMGNLSPNNPFNSRFEIYDMAVGPPYESSNERDKKIIQNFPAVDSNEVENVSEKLLFLASLHKMS